MTSSLSDIEDFTTDELRAEIARREQAYREGECWYCKQNLKIHTCKYSKTERIPGWIFDPPRFIRTDDCMANEIEYWQVNAKNHATGKYAIGTGSTPDEATEKCIQSVERTETTSRVGPFGTISQAEIKDGIITGITIMQGFKKSTD